MSVVGRTVFSMSGAPCTDRELGSAMYRQGDVLIVPVADERGWFTHWVSVQRDVTERREAHELSARIRVAEEEKEELAGEIRERRRVEEELLYTAFHDSLTRLRNRAYFMDRLASVVSRASDVFTGCAVLFLDLDRFDRD